MKCSNHTWKKYYGLTPKTIWYNCKDCGVSKEEYDKIQQTQRSTTPPPIPIKFEASTNDPYIKAYKVLLTPEEYDEWLKSGGL